MRLSRKLMFPFIFAFIGSLIAAGAVLWSSYNQIKDAENQAAEAKRNSRLQEEKSQEIIRLQQDLLKAQKDLKSEADVQKHKTEEISKLSRELAEKADTQNQKTEEIARLNLELANAVKETKELNSKSLNYLTGGDSWCFVELFGEENGKINVHLQHRGEYPLSALRVLITRASAARRDYGNNNPGALKYAMYSEKYATVIPIGPLPKPVGLNAVTYPVISAITYGSVPFDSNIDEHYSILFMAQNGYWTQEYSITYDEHKSRNVSYVVKRDNKILWSHPQ